VEYDEAIRLDIARNIRRQRLPLRSLGASGALVFDHTLLHFYLLAALASVLGESVLLARLVTALSALGSVVLVYVILNRHAGASAAIVGALVLATNPFFAVYSYFVRPEVMLCFWALLALYAVLTWSDGGGLRSLWLAGGALAVGVLLKELMVITVLSAMVYVWLTGNDFRTRVVASVGLILPPALALIGWGLFAWSLSPEVSRAVLNRWFHAVVGGGTTDTGRIGVGAAAWLGTVGGTVLGWGLVGLLVTTLLWATIRRLEITRLVKLFAVYAVVLLLASVSIHLKEPRYVIELIPAVAVLVGATGDWRRLMIWIRSAPLPKRLVLIPIGLLIIALSPLRLVPGDTSGIEKWVDPFFYYRAVHSDSYYSALANAGAYLNAHTPPDAVIAVIHEATVVGYYADRSYRMLYTLSLDETLQVLAQTEYLVFDHVVFVRQVDSEIQEVLDYIDAHFELEHEVQDPHRQITILRRVQAAVSESSGTPAAAEGSKLPGDLLNPFTLDERHRGARHHSQITPTDTAVYPP
jgi:hypothetical protein